MSTDALRKLLYSCKAAMVESAKSPYKTEWRNMIAAIDSALASPTEGAAQLTDEQILDVTTKEFPFWREDISPSFVLQVVRAALAIQEKKHG